MQTLEKITQNCLIKTIHGEKYTPFSLSKKLGAKVLLESATFGSGKSRYSIILHHKAFTVFQKQNTFYMERDGKVFTLKNHRGDMLDLLNYFARQHRRVVPFPLPAGGAGYLCYEYCSHFDDIKFIQKPDPLGIPDAFFIFGHTFLVFDHYTDTITIIALNYKEHRIDLEKAIQELESRIHDLDFNYLNYRGEEYTGISLNTHEEKESFLKGVQKVRREIIKGNLLQGVLSRRLLIRTEIPALEAYRRLRSLNPSPYMFYLDFGSYQLFGSSPEMHVKVEGNRVMMRPIAGTRKRGKNIEEDRKLEKELLSDQKERAEHLMLVDLARNDLGRVCTPGSVQVSEFMTVEHYSHVMHLVSQVEGTLEKGKTGLEALRKSFPAGTVSGAPKIQAIQTIDTLEPVKRSFYAGVVGYIEPDLSLNTCITIRSGLKMDDILVLQAGAGIVYDSVPEREYQETVSKLKALGASIGVEV